MNRIKALRTRLEWPQSALAAFLGLAQPAVTRMEAGQPESGPVSRLVDALTSALDRGAIAKGATPEDCLRAIGATPPDKRENAA